MRLIFICLAGLLTACASPQDRCVRSVQSEMQSLDSRIAEVETALARGYRTQPASEARTTLSICAWPREPVLFCTTHTPAQRESRVAVDVPAEQARLERLRAERADLVAAQADRIAACRRLG